ncbi:hypothetical protein NECAME_04505 [Necator americanus]|uniref:Uncharacterized protein n=1 Tax=Necator americanus TaxID=51031 RepID=W2SRU4_NECAM|nr:hypothetical protein NECAME_04505 [Necator americanus]ETN72325.1 hypothetical protein NECAME_04505 [Necator americanus]
MKFTVATELRKLFPCNCTESMEKAHMVAEMSSSADDSVSASNYAAKPESAANPPMSVSASSLIEESAPSTNAIKREGDDDTSDVWRNESALFPTKNRDFPSSDTIIEERVIQLETTVEKLGTRVLDLERAFRAGSLTKSQFGRKEVTSSQQYVFKSPGPRFNDLDLVAEYSSWRTFVPDLLYMNEERKMSSFIKHIYSRVVSNENDKLLLTTRSGGRDNGLLRVPNELRVVLRDFVVDVCDPPDRLALGAAVLKCMKTVADNVRRQTNTDPNHDQDDTVAASNPSSCRKRKIPTQLTGTYQSPTVERVQPDEGIGLYNAPDVDENGLEASFDYKLLAREEGEDENSNRSRLDVLLEQTRHKLEEVQGSKRETRRRCAACYRTMSRNYGATVARARSRMVNTRCSKCKVHYCLGCFQNEHKECQSLYTRLKLE